MIKYIINYTIKHFTNDKKSAMMILTKEAD